METYGLIPIRQGSKRFINKNFSNFKDTNLLMNCISKLIKANIYNIFISTDIPEPVLNYINNSKPCDYFNKANINIINRPPELALDNSTTEEVILNSIVYINKYNISRSIDTDYTIILCQVTSPCWSYHRLIYGYEVYKSEKIPVVSVKPDYSLNGCFYIFSKDMFIKNSGIYSDKMKLVILPWEESIDIDYKYQLNIAESI